MTRSGTADSQLRRSRRLTGFSSGAVSVMTLTASLRRTVQRRDRPLSLFLDFEHLLAAIAARLQVDVVRTAELARLLVLDISRRRKRVVASPIAALHARYFAFRYSHD